MEHRQTESRIILDTYELYTEQIHHPDLNKKLKMSFNISKISVNIKCIK